MFGMSSREFWEDEPQLYWAYRFSYEKQLEFEHTKEIEQMRFSCWLQGKTNEIAFAIALNNAFNKSKKTYPNYNEFFRNAEEYEKNPVKADLEVLLDGVTDKDERGNIEFNYWARL